MRPVASNGGHRPGFWLGVSQLLRSGPDSKKPRRVFGTIGTIGIQAVLSWQTGKPGRIAGSGSADHAGRGGLLPSPVPKATENRPACENSRAITPGCSVFSKWAGSKSIPPAHYFFAAARVPPSKRRAIASAGISWTSVVATKSVRSTSASRFPDGIVNLMMNPPIWMPWLL